jgi:hypothetical protein
MICQSCFRTIASTAPMCVYCGARRRWWWKEKDERDRRIVKKKRIEKSVKMA